MPYEVTYITGLLGAPSVAKKDRRDLALEGGGRAGTRGGGDGTIVWAYLIGEGCCGVHSV